MRQKPEEKEMRTRVRSTDVVKSMSSRIYVDAISMSRGHLPPQSVSKLVAVGYPPPLFVYRGVIPSVGEEASAVQGRERGYGLAGYPGSTCPWMMRLGSR